MGPPYWIIHGGSHVCQFAWARCIRIEHSGPWGGGKGGPAMDNQMDGWHRRVTCRVAPCSSKARIKMRGVITKTPHADLWVGVWASLHNTGNSVTNSSIGCMCFEYEDAGDVQIAIQKQFRPEWGNNDSNLSNFRLQDAIRQETTSKQCVCKGHIILPQLEA